MYMEKQQAANNVIKAHLWTFGHSVKDVSEIPGTTYNLLINGKIRMTVIIGDPDGMGPVHQPDCDVVSFVYGTAKNPKKRYARNGGTEFFPTPKSVITIE